MGGKVFGGFHDVKFRESSRAAPIAHTPYLRRMNLVSGASGLVGTHLLLELLSRGEPVRAIHRGSGSRSTSLRLLDHYGLSAQASHIEWAEGDVLDVEFLQEVMSGCSAAYHCAALVSYHPSDRRRMYKVNVEGTANMVNVALREGSVAFAHVSSTAAVGRPKGFSGLLNEKSPWTESNHPTHYAVTKHFSEMEVWRGMEEGLKAVILNPGFIIGPGDFSRSSGAMFSRIARGMPFYPPGGTGFVSAGDTARALVELTSRGCFGERFIAVAENMKMQDVFAMVAGALGKPIPIRKVSTFQLYAALLAEQVREWVTGRRAVVTREVVRNMSSFHRYDSSRLMERIGFEFQPIPEAIRQTSELFLRGF